MEYKYIVCTSCPTYNHKPFIKMAMDGFCMQKTNFPVVTVIIDDASTDGTDMIIRDYVEQNFEFNDKSISYQKNTDFGNITFARHKSNKNCYFAVIYLKENHYSKNISKEIYREEWTRASKYMAICEGDDYWIDENKLQIQVDFLDNNKDYSICSHRIYKYDEDNKLYYEDRLNRLFKQQEGIDYDNRSKVWLSETSSVVYRKESNAEYELYPNTIRDNIHVYFLLKVGKGFCLNKRMSVYRQHMGGVFSKQNVKKRLLEGGYMALKELYEYEKTPDSRFLYLYCYANTFLSTKGTILFKEPFELWKILSLFRFIPFTLSGIHPVYKVLPNAKEIE